MSKVKVIRTKEGIAAQAYIIVGAIAHEFDIMGNSNIIKALDYFSLIANKEEDKAAGQILPWDIGDINEMPSMQAKIDALMLEFCPEDMTFEQIECYQAAQILEKEND